MFTSTTRFGLTQALANTENFMAIEEKTAPPPPLFSIALGDNGGTLAPSTEQELIAHISGEINFWNWIHNRNLGKHESHIRDSLNILNSALSNAQQMSSLKDSNPDRWRNHLTSVENSLRGAFLDRRLPHTNTPLANEIAAIRQEHGDAAASFYAGASTDQQGLTYQPTDLSSWIGLIEAIGNLNKSTSNRKIQSAAKSLDSLRAKFESQINEKRELLDQITRDFEKVQAAALDSQASHNSQFIKDQEDRSSNFDAQLTQHHDGMGSIRKAFKEEISLRAPAEYWKSKRRAHRIISTLTGIASFAAIGGCAFFLAYEIKFLLDGTPQGQTPQHWRVAVLALVSLFSVWAVRLIVRIFLSQLHLVTDASERIVMLETYLSLTEGNQLTDDGERKLILTSLFRPASDGIVKDEGVPPSFIDVLTRSPRQ